MPEAARNYYADLDVSPNASEEEINKAFRKLALKCHPDRNPGHEAEFKTKFQEINAAHEILCDFQQRRQYDAEREKYRSRNVLGNKPSFHPCAPSPKPRAPQFTNFRAPSPKPRADQSTNSRAPLPKHRPHQSGNGIFGNSTTAQSWADQKAFEAACAGIHDRWLNQNQPGAEECPSYSQDAKQNASHQEEQTPQKNASTRGPLAPRYDPSPSEQGGDERQARQAPSGYKNCPQTAPNPPKATFPPNPHQSQPKTNTPTIVIPSKEDSKQSESALNSSRFTPKNRSPDRGQQQQHNSYCRGNERQDFPPPKNPQPSQAPTGSESNFEGSESKHKDPGGAQFNYRTYVEEVSDYEGDWENIKPPKVSSTAPKVEVNPSTQLPKASAENLTFPRMPKPPKTPECTPALIDIYLQQFERYTRDYLGAMRRMNLCSRLQPTEPDSLPPRFCHDRSETGSTIGFDSHCAQTMEHIQILKMWQECYVEHLEALRECEKVRQNSAEFLSDSKD
jgi:curved DNA-binding protein CbpA